MPKSTKVKAKPRAYTGDLAEPIYEPISWGAISNLEVRKAQAEHGASERRLAKLKLLFDWYKIDSSANDSWASLALALAEAHVPGMRVIYESQPKRGRRRTWKAGRYKELWVDVEEVRSRGVTRVSAAIDVLRADHARDWHRFPRSSLIARHGEAVRERKKLGIFATQVMTTSVDLRAPSGSLFAMVNWNALPSTMPLKRRLTK